MKFPSKTISMVLFAAAANLCAIAYSAEQPSGSRQDSSMVPGTSAQPEKKGAASSMPSDQPMKTTTQAALPPESIKKVDFDKYGFEKKTQLTQALKNQLSLLDKNINKLTQETQTSQAAAAPEKQQVIEDLQAKKIEAKSALQNLQKASSPERWDTAKAEMAQSYEELVDSYKEAYQNSSQVQ